MLFEKVTSSAYLNASQKVPPMKQLLQKSLSVLARRVSRLTRCQDTHRIMKETNSRSGGAVCIFILTLFLFLRGFLHSLGEFFGGILIFGKN